MHSLRSALFPILVAACCVAGACTRVPSVRVEAHAVEGTRPTLWALRCFADGLPPPVKLSWRLSPGAKPVAGAPQDEPVDFVQPPGRDVAWAECAATGADNKTVRATHSLVAIAVNAAPAAAKAGALVTVRGSGFGPWANADDRLWLVPPWGRAFAADSSCKGAAWTDAAVTACVPAAARGKSWQLRVQAADTLAIAPKPLVVAP
ncbi:MAG TPA: hypothetical protein VGL86_20415 [Polyangia bacterium]